MISHEPTHETEHNDVEATLFWQISAELRHALAGGAPQVEIDDLYDELEGVEVNTDSPAIRSRCAALLGSRAKSAGFGFI